MLEKQVENRLKAGVKKLGGVAIKFYSPWFTKFPDRIVLVPFGHIWFVETKRPGKRPDKGQTNRLKWLEKLGFNTAVASNYEEVDRFLAALKIQQDADL